MRFLATLVALCAVVPEFAAAQRTPTAFDTATARQIKVARDSVRCITSPRSSADQCSRARLRLDSIRTGLTCPRALAPTIPAGGWFCPSGPVPPPAAGTIATIEVTAGPPTDTRYASRIQFDPIAGADTVTVCAIVYAADSSKSIGWRPLRLRTIGDSATASLRGGNTLESMCGAAAELTGATIPDSVTAPAVGWCLQWIDHNGRRILRPLAHSLKPGVTTACNDDENF